MAEMKLLSELTRLRNTQNDRKVKTKYELSLQFNMALDKETELLVNSAEIEDGHGNLISGWTSPPQPKTKSVGRSENFIFAKCYSCAGNRTQTSRL